MIYKERQIVGHYAIIPIRLIMNEKSIISGKGEALYVDSKIRKERIENMSAGIAIMEKLHTFALSNGVEIIHNITRPEIGITQQFMGFKKNFFKQKKYFFVLKVAQNDSNVLRLSKYFASLIQNIYYFILLLFHSHNSSVIEINNMDSMPKIFLLMRQRMDSFQDKIYVSRDDEMLYWQAGLGRLNIFSLKKNPNAYITTTVTKKRMDILDFDIGSLSHKNKISLLKKLLCYSKENNLEYITLNSNQVAENFSSVWYYILRAPLIRKSIKTYIYTKNNSSIRSEINIHFDTLFNL